MSTEGRVVTGRPWFFGDEWQRGARYGYVVIAASNPQDLAGIRRELRGILLPGERRLHMSGEKPARRRVALDLVARLPVRALVVQTVGHPSDAREECLGRLLPMLEKAEAARLTLERPDQAQEARDRRCIRHLLDRGAGPADLVYEHADPHGEPMLWAADIVAWAVGKGNGWAPRVSNIVEHVR
jgi:hypothetical protein